MSQPRARRITSWLFDATSFKPFVAFDKPKISNICHLPCRIKLTNCTKIEVNIWTEALILYKYILPTENKDLQNGMNRQRRKGRSDEAGKVHRSEKLIS